MLFLSATSVWFFTMTTMLASYSMVTYTGRKQPKKITVVILSIVNYDLWFKPFLKLC